MLFFWSCIWARIAYSQIILSFLWQFTLPGSSKRQSLSRSTLLDDRETSRNRPLSTSSLRRSTSTTATSSAQPPSPPQEAAASAMVGGIRTSLSRALSTRSNRDSTLLVRPTSLAGVPPLPTSGAGEHQITSLPRASPGSDDGGTGDGNVV
ncbi:hypothetical protein BCR44DRAFT_58980 [Catenaria anguillulae PL171]|uniref:Uncharacterized protein n=1 Tax=Catenaria anguillulae PL171 TaxID=765915 RepID=A0A1Y2I4G7_9FUNG|nr:hypothetical protein BCR44DRAFT_58980 [Catenaria anguillulae PL171]